MDPKHFVIECLVREVCKSAVAQGVTTEQSCVALNLNPKPIVLSQKTLPPTF